MGLFLPELLHYTNQYLTIQNNRLIFDSFIHKYKQMIFFVPLQIILCLQKIGFQLIRKMLGQRRHILQQCLANTYYDLDSWNT